MIPLQRAAQTLKALTGLAIAEATPLAWLLRPRKALACWEAAASDELNVTLGHGGVLVHDRWAGCFTYWNWEQALCGSHLLRDLRLVEVTHGRAWAKCLLDTCRKACERPDKAIYESACKAVGKRFRTILSQARRELPTRLDGQRGSVAQSDADNLH